MPAISMVGLLIVGSLTSQIMAGASLLLMIASVNVWTHHKVSKAVRAVLLGTKGLIRRLVERKGGEVSNVDASYKLLEEFPTLEQSEAPFNDRKTLNFEEIQAILDANDDRYRINPTHLTKNFEPPLKLAENWDFGELIRLWDKIGEGWTQPDTARRLLSRAVDDKRFIDFLKVRFPEAKRFHYKENEDPQRQRAALTMHKKQIEGYVEILAKEKGCSSERFIADWIKEQLRCFVEKLEGRRPSEGQHRFLCDAAENTAQIIPFLLDPKTFRLYVEDALEKIAVEGGDYCALGMWRASNEVKEGFVEPLRQEALQSMEPQKAFECEVMNTLQRMRLAGGQAFFREATTWLQNKEETQDTAADIHLHQAMTHALGRGLLPLPEKERNDFSFIELMLNQTLFLPPQIELLRQYRRWLDDAGTGIANLAIDRTDVRRNKVLEYLRAWVNTNDALSAQQKETLLTGPLLNDDESRADYNNPPKWNRLFMVVLGILEEKQGP